MSNICKDIRRTAAEKRTAERAKRTAQEQVSLLDSLGMRAVRERTRLQQQIDGNGLITPKKIDKKKVKA